MLTNTKSTRATPDSARHAPAARPLGARERLVVSTLALTMAALGAQGCAVEVDPEDEDLQTAQAALPWTGDGAQVASVQTAAGSLVRFVSSPDDELGVGVVGRI